MSTHELSVLPEHVAIVMDGNGRWANNRGLPRTAGHEQGEETLMRIVRAAIDLGIKELSAYAFSTENWKRSPAEVRFIMGFSRQVLRRQREILHSWNVKIRWVGRAPKLWESVLKELRIAEELTKNNTGLVLNLCINYGGRKELVDAARAIAEQVASGTLSASDVNEKMLHAHMYAPSMRDVDLLIRTGGEMRTSNFLMWQSAYAELYFSPVLWPDYTVEDLREACIAYAGRQRRFGGAVDAVADVNASGDKESGHA